MRRIPSFRTLTSIAFLAALIVFTISAAEAASPRYTFVEGGWFKFDPDRAGSDTGFFFGGSGGTRRFHFFAEYADPGNFETVEAGGGWHGLFGERADLVLQAAWIDIDVDDGLRLEGGIRWMLLEKLEINGFVSYTDFDFDESTAVAVNGIWDITPRFGVGGGYEAGDEFDTARLFARFNFGKN
jgi:hypothetical protein